MHATGHDGKKIVLRLSSEEKKTESPFNINNFESFEHDGNATGHDGKKIVLQSIDRIGKTNMTKKMTSEEINEYMDNFEKYLNKEKIPNNDLSHKYHRVKNVQNLELEVILLRKQIKFLENEIKKLKTKCNSQKKTRKKGRRIKRSKSLGPKSKSSRSKKKLGLNSSSSESS